MNLTTDVINGSSTPSQCSGLPIVERPQVFWAFTVVYAIVFLSCFIGNLFLFVVLVTHRSMRTATNFFLANLAAADLLVGVFCIVQNWARLFLYTTWHLGSFLCYAYVFVLHAVPCISAGILVLVSGEKFIALQRPLWARKVLTNRLRIGLTLTVWLTGFAANWPLMHTVQFFTFDSQQICAMNNAYDMEKLFYTVSFVIWYCVPVLIMSILYANIGCLLWKSTSGILADSSRRSAGGLSSSVTSAQPGSSPASDTGERGGFSDAIVRSFSKMSRVSNRSSVRQPQSSANTTSSTATESRRRVVRLLVAVVLAFAVLSLPHHMRLLWRYSKPRHYVYCISAPVALWQPIAYVMLFANSGINPFLYAFLSQRFRGINPSLYAFLSQRFRDASAQLVRSCVGGGRLDQGGRGTAGAQARQTAGGSRRPMQQPAPPTNNTNTMVTANGTTVLVRSPKPSISSGQQLQQQHQKLSQPDKSTAKHHQQESMKRRKLMMLKCTDGSADGSWKMSGESEMDEMAAVVAARAGRSSTSSGGSSFGGSPTKHLQHHPITPV